MNEPAQNCFITEADNPTPIQLLKTDDYGDWIGQQPEATQLRLNRQSFSGKAGSSAWLEEQGAGLVVVSWDGENNLSTLGGLAASLPEGDYTLIDEVSDLQLIGWGLGAYQFNRYKAAKRSPARLLLPSRNQQAKVLNTVAAMALARDLVNTPAADMLPSHLAAEATTLAEQFGAQWSVTVGDELLDRECGGIHSVGRAADDPPCLIEFTWGDPSHPKVTVIGKGVTFDSGGLNLKPANGMRWMKKDMGGAATALGLAYLIMAQQLEVRLRVLIPAAENAISGNAFRPGDVLTTHKGITVEIDNTDAEGRLLLCDALSIASEEQDAMIFDFATLTGSARSAVGPDIGAMFCNDAGMAQALGEYGRSEDDTVWHMPLHAGYEHMLNSKVADMVNSASSPYAGAIVAGLFLQRFVGVERWAHFDIMAFNTRTRPAHPEGGEAMGLRAVYAYLEQLYGTA